MNMNEDGGTVYQTLLFSEQKKGRTYWMALFHHVGLGPASLAMAGRDVP